MKVISGIFKGRELVFSGKYKIRPTCRLIRKAIFDTLGSWIEGKKVLDIFSGSGALGLEALSAGAKQVFFIEENSTLVNKLRDTISSMGIQGYCVCLKGKVEKMLGKLSGESFHLVLADPPYALASEQIEKIFAIILEKNLLKPEGFLILERPSWQESVYPSGYSVWKEKKYGQTVLTYFQPALNRKGRM